MGIDIEKVKMKAAAGRVFSPGAPINQYELFAGRIELVGDVIRGVNQRGQHVVIFGERGVGKTSLASVLKEFIEEQVLVVKINCDSGDNFYSLWKKIFREIHVVLREGGWGFAGKDKDVRITFDKLIDGNEKVSPEDIRYILEQYPGILIIIIDEVDRIKDKKTTSLMADTIKSLSDHSLSATIVLVGVADMVDELISEHTSIERPLVQVRMPRMSIVELQEILDKGYSKLGMSIDNDAKARIVRLSQGLPHYTHLLGLHSAEVAIDKGRNNIQEEDVDVALHTAITKAQQTIISMYNKATISPRETLFPQVLLSCALAKKDELGAFAASDVRQPLTVIMGKKYEIPAFARHLNEFCTGRRGPVLQKLGIQRRFRYRFINPMLEPYTVVHGLAKNLITEKQLLELPG